jgi:hypothetical protein
MIACSGEFIRIPNKPHLGARINWLAKDSIWRGKFPFYPAASCKKGSIKAWEVHIYYRGALNLRQFIPFLINIISGENSYFLQRIDSHPPEGIRTWRRPHLCSRLPLFVTTLKNGIFYPFTDINKSTHKRIQESIGWQVIQSAFIPDQDYVHIDRALWIRNNGKGKKEI